MALWWKADLCALISDILISAGNNKRSRSRRRASSSEAGVDSRCGVFDVFAIAVAGDSRVIWEGWFMILQFVYAIALQNASDFLIM